MGIRFEGFPAPASSVARLGQLKSLNRAAAAAEASARGRRFGTIHSTRKVRGACPLSAAPCAWMAATKGAERRLRRCADPLPLWCADRL